MIALRSENHEVRECGVETLGCNSGVTSTFHGRHLAKCIQGVSKTDAAGHPFMLKITKHDSLHQQLRIRHISLTRIHKPCVSPTP